MKPRTVTRGKRGKGERKGGKIDSLLILQSLRRNWGREESALAKKGKKALTTNYEKRATEGSA